MNMFTILFFSIRTHHPTPVYTEIQGLALNYFFLNQGVFNKVQGTMKPPGWCLTTFYVPHEIIIFLDFDLFTSVARRLRPLHRVPIHPPPLS